MQHNKNKYSSGITVGVILVIVGFIILLTSVNISNLFSAGSVWG